MITQAMLAAFFERFKFKRPKLFAFFIGIMWGIVAILQSLDFFEVNLPEIVDKIQLAILAITSVASTSTKLHLDDSHPAKPEALKGHQSPA